MKLTEQEIQNIIHPVALPYEGLSPVKLHEIGPPKYPNIVHEENGTDLHKYYTFNNMSHENELSIQPYFDRLFVIRDETPDKTESGVIIPNSDKEKANRGIVVAVGCDCILSFPGQHIVFGQHHGVDVMVGGTEYTILREQDIYAGDKRPIPSADEICRIITKKPNTFLKDQPGTGYGM